MAKILVVDDDATNLRLAVTVLEQAGHEVLSAQGGIEGIASALAHAPDLVLMDIQMAGMDGVSALRRLRAEPRTAALKVAALTALVMKGDRAFVQHMTTNADDMAIVSTVTALGHNLKLKVIAEGVETEEQRKFLQLLKCDQFQGYLFSKPVPAEEVPALLARGEKRP